MKTPNKVFLFACIEKNIGDDIFVKLVCDRYPETTFVITEKARYGSLSRIDNLEFSADLQKWLWTCGIGPRSACKSVVGHLLGRYYRLRMPRCRCAIHIVGNTFKNRAYEGWFQSRWVREQIRLVKEYFLVSTNFGPYTDPRWRDDFARIFPRMKDVCFRDKRSFELFKELPSVRYAPDAVLSLGRQEHFENRNTVVISVIDCAMTERGADLNESAQTYEVLMAACAERYACQGKKVVLLNANAQQDGPAAERILKRCKNQENIRICSYEGDLETVFTLYASAQKVIGTRLHTIILAWLFDVPVVPIVYDIKVKSILQAYDFPEPQYDICDLGSVRAEKIEQDLSRYKYKVPDSLIRQAGEQFKRFDEALQR